MGCTCRRRSKVLRNRSGRSSSRPTAGGSPRPCSARPRSGTCGRRSWSMRLAARRTNGRAAFAPSDGRFASIVDDHTVAVWSLQSGEQLLSFETGSEYLTSLAFSPDGARIVTAAHRGLVEIWVAQTGARLRGTYCPDLDLRALLAVAVRPDGKIVS